MIDDILPQARHNLGGCIVVGARRGSDGIEPTPAALAAAVADTLHGLGIVAPHVVGHSLGTVAGRPVGRILSVAPTVHLTATIMGATMSYVLVAEGTTTRLLLKVVTSRGRLVAPLISLGDLVMARRQLLNLKRLAEGQR